MRFIHTADIHLDSPLAGLAARAGERARDLVGATRRAFTGLIDAAVDQAVDFVVIAGDLYDGDWRDFSTGLFFAEGMARLEHAGIRVALVKGNHDAENAMTRSLSLPPNVHVFRSDRAETVVWENLGVALHGRSYGQRAMRDNIAGGYPAPVPGLLNVGVLHTAADGRPGHEPYAPCALAELAAKGYGYWALGHVHAREVLSERPWIVFPGNLQGRHANETGPKGFTLVTADAGEVMAVEHVDCDVVRWARVPVEVGGCAGLDEVGERVRAALGEALAGAGRRTLAVRLTLTGRGAVHRALVGDPDRTAAECEVAAMRAGGDVWIEKVELRTAEPDAGAAALPDALGELLRAVEEVRADPAEHDGLRAELEALLSRMPHAVRAEAGLDELGDELLAAVLEDARAIVLGRLAGEGA
ncbi:metallophosphoesterase family protein [Azospirillum sp.]|uniref:metallophosphoesterase family protein n=1 Tax=Azospirillum sp. TaxID=34012 RepID=UPI003D74A96D